MHLINKEICIFHLKIWKNFLNSNNLNKQNILISLIIKIIFKITLKYLN